MLIDNAIVVAENIFRLRQLGFPPKEAAAAGMREVSLAVVLATLTTVAVFVPVMFLGGESEVRTLMSELGLPVCYSLIASLLVALLFIPLATLYFAGSGASGAKHDPGQSRPARIYQQTVHWVLRHRFVSALIALAILMSSSAPQSLMRESGEERRTSEIELDVRCPRYFNLRETDDVMRRLQEVIDPLKEELEIEVVAAWYTNRGGSLAMFLQQGRQTSRNGFLEKLQPHLPTIPGVQIRLGMGNEDDVTQSEVWVEARGRDPVVLDSLLSRVAERLRPEAGILEVTTNSSRNGGDEIQVLLQRERAQRYNVSPSSIAQIVSWSLRGAPLTDFETDDEELPFWIQFAGSDMENIADLYGVEVFADDGSSVSLVNLADFKVSESLPQIYRRDGRVRQWMQVVTETSVDQRLLKLRMQDLFSRLDVPDGYELYLREGDRQQEFDNAWQVAVLSVVLIYIILGVLFESFWLPITVVLNIPFMSVGSLWLMYILDEPLTFVSAIGFVILLGIIVNNAIVFVDCINRFRDRQLQRYLVFVAAASSVEGMTVDLVHSLGERAFGRASAIAAAGAVRARPILMTACTTICGLLPLVIFRQEGEGLDYRPLAVVVLGGLGVSTVMTLFIVPLFYTVFDDFRQLLTRGLFRARRPA
jgi:HAE1 family hydrophobic/amphiphilic exporter-1